MSEQEKTSILGLLSRGFWMMWGPMILVPLVYKIIEHGNGWLTGFDIAYLAVLGSLGAARWVEFHTGEPKTAEGAVATPSHLRRYMMGVAAFGVPLWVAANVLGNYVVNGSQG